MLVAGDGLERVKPSGPWAVGEDPVPQFRPDPGDTGEVTFRYPETNRPLQPRHVREQFAHAMLAVGVHDRNEEDRSFRERADHGLLCRSEVPMPGASRFAVRILRHPGCEANRSPAPRRLPPGYRAS